MEDKLKYFRQPIVTASGILLGFVLNMAGGWAANPQKRQDYHSLIIVVCLAICILLLLIVLFRALNMNYPKEGAEDYYKRTLLFLILGILIIFINIMYLIIQNYFLGS